jgi:hypothetical protein
VPGVSVPAGGSGPSLNSRSLPVTSDGWLSKAEVLTSWGDWLSTRWEWDWWVTLTYDPKRRPSGSATHTAVGWGLSDRHFHEWLAEAVGDSEGSESVLPAPFWLRGREPNKFRYGTHFHALVGGVGTDTSRRRAWEAWFQKHGMARVERYDPARGAGFYVSKYVVKQLGDLQFSRNAGQYMKGVEG